MKNTAIVLAGGSGSRMKSTVKKQYQMLQGRPLLCYSLEVFQKCEQIDEIILVCGKGEIEQCRQQIVEKYKFRKVARIVEGGTERYHSVYEGLKAIKDCDYVLIHDGARPFVNETILNRILDALPGCRACAAGVPVKDTIKMSSPDGFVERTLPRELLWTIQTPQAFVYTLIKEAYDKLAFQEVFEVNITDDAMVAEYMMHIPVKLIEGSYDNIKITTPEDLLMAELILNNRKLKNQNQKN